MDFYTTGPIHGGMYFKYCTFETINCSCAGWSEQDQFSVLTKFCFINPCHAEYVYVLHFSPIFYLVNLQHSSYKHAFTSRVENSVDPDQMASSEAS